MMLVVATKRERGKSEKERLDLSGLKFKTVILPAHYEKKNFCISFHLDGSYYLSLELREKLLLGFILVE